MAKTKKDLIKQSETVVIKRSEIKFAAYNPRKKSQKVVEALKSNFKKVGFLGGIQWNSVTGNLIGGHKRLEALDLVYGYDGSPEKDYEVKVERIELDIKTEKEQNIFLNNRRVQGETDFELMAELIQDIDVENAALDEYDIDLIESLVPDFKFASNDDIKAEINEMKANAQKSESEKKEHVKNMKKLMNENTAQNQRASHFIVTFKSYNEKAEFLESCGINGDDVYLTSKVFFDRILK